MQSTFSHKRANKHAALISSAIRRPWSVLHGTGKQILRLFDNTSESTFADSHVLNASVHLFRTKINVLHIPWAFWRYFMWQGGTLHIQHGVFWYFPEWRERNPSHFMQWWQHGTSVARLLGLQRRWVVTDVHADLSRKLPPLHFSLQTAARHTRASECALGVCTPQRNVDLMDSNNRGKSWSLWWMTLPLCTLHEATIEIKLDINSEEKFPMMLSLSLGYIFRSAIPVVLSHFYLTRRTNIQNDTHTKKHYPLFVSQSESNLIFIMAGG